MSKWQLIRELFKGVGFYKKQFNFFVCLFGIIFAFYGIIKYNNYMSADPMSSSDIIQSDTTPSGNSQTININVTKDGRVFRDGRVVSMIELGKDYDQLRYKIIDQPGSIIDQLTVRVNFEPVITNRSVISDVISKHTDNGLNKNTYTYTESDHVIVYSGVSLGPDTTFTIHARLPKGVISPPWWRSGATDITSLSIFAWIIIGLSLPLITLCILFLMLIKRWRLTHVSPGPTITNPPEPLPPAIVGVLMYGRIGPREIAATLVDLANRGYIHIFEGDNNFSFGRGRALESEKIYDLNPYEKVLLSKIFDSNKATNSIRDINIALGKTLFSQKMAQVFLEIYTIVENLGYFQQNPGLTHQKYKISGMILFLFGSIGFVLNILFNRAFPYMLFFWVGMMATSTLILFFAPKMPLSTAKGKAARKNWLGFKNYLSQKTTLSFEESNQNPYSKYLPYAIVMGVEVDWTRHFYSTPFFRPSWFDSSPSVSSIEDFANMLFPLVGYASQNLTVSRTPVID